jgi:hypothetical protein
MIDLTNERENRDGGEGRRRGAREENSFFY